MYRARHARPSCLPARAAVGTSLTAVLLPLAMATPALAQETAAPTTTSSPTATPTASPLGTASPAPTATSTSPTAEAAPVVEDERAQTTMRISADPIVGSTSRIGVRLLADGQRVPNAEVVVERAENGGWTPVGRLTTDAEGLAVGHLPFSGPATVRATHAGGTDRTAGASPQASVVERTASTMRISAGDTGGDGTGRIGVRLLRADGSPIRGMYVAVEALSGDGSWKYIGRALTDDSGLAVGRFRFSRDTRVRSTFSGDRDSLPRTSPEAVVRYNTLGEMAVRIAAQQEGKPYRYGSTGPNSFDCSGFTTYIYKTRLGKSIPRTSAQQEAALPRVPQSAKRPGDLLFFRSGSRVSHVGVYAGGGKMWAAPTTGDRVKLQSIYSSSYTVGRVS